MFGMRKTSNRSKIVAFLVIVPISLIGSYWLIASQAASSVVPFLGHFAWQVRNDDGQYVAPGSYAAGDQEDIFILSSWEKSAQHTTERLVVGLTYDASVVDVTSVTCMTPWVCNNLQYTGPVRHTNGAQNHNVHSAYRYICFSDIAVQRDYSPVLQVKVTFKQLGGVPFIVSNGFVTGSCADNNIQQTIHWNGQQGWCSSDGASPCYGGPNPGGTVFNGFNASESDGATHSSGGNAGTSNNNVAPGSGSTSSSTQNPRQSSTVIAEKPNAVPEQSANGTQQEPPRVKPSPFYDGREYERGSTKDGLLFSSVQDGGSKYGTLIFVAVLVAAAVLFTVLLIQKRKHATKLSTSRVPPSRPRKKRT